MVCPDTSPVLPFHCLLEKRAHAQRSQGACGPPSRNRFYQGAVKAPWLSPGGNGRCPCQKEVAQKGGYLAQPHTHTESHAHRMSYLYDESLWRGGGVRREQPAPHTSPGCGIVWQLTRHEELGSILRVCCMFHKRDFYQGNHLSLSKWLIARKYDRFSN